MSSQRLTATIVHLGGVDATAHGDKDMLGNWRSPPVPARNRRSQGIYCMDTGPEGARAQCPQASLLFKRYGHSSDVPISASGSGPRRRGPPPSPRFSLCVTDRHHRSHVVLADRRLDLGSQIVAAGFLPGHAATFGNHSRVAVPDTGAWGCDGGVRHAI